MAKQNKQKKNLKIEYKNLILNYINEYDKFLLKLAYGVKIKCPKDDIEDIKQDIIYTLFSKGYNLKSDKKQISNTYFSQIAINSARNYIRTYWQKKNRANVDCISLDSYMYDSENGDGEKYINLVAEDEESYLNPEQYYLNNELFLRIKKFLSKLSSFEKKVFLMFFLNHSSIAEIAKKTKKSNKTIYNILAVIKDKAKNELDFL